MRYLFSSLAAMAALLSFPGNNAYAQTTAVRANDFLNSIGVCTHIAQHKDKATSVAPCLTYAGIRNIREMGTTDPAIIQAWINIHKITGVKMCLEPGGNMGRGLIGNLSHSISQYEQMAAAGALLAVEGPNEPNNAPVTYNGQTSGKDTTFLPVAQFQRDLYTAVKADPKLAGIPVFASSCAGGSEPDNVGLQYLTIPSGAGTLMPDGTQYADFTNCHNYVRHRGQPSMVDNNAWQAEDPTAHNSWDLPYHEYHRTWKKHFTGYSTTQLQTLPRVTTETGWPTGPCQGAEGGKGAKPITETQQGKLLVNVYLDAYKRGWSYTFIYMLKDTTRCYHGLFHVDYTPKLSATYLHNLTTILADHGSITPGSLKYSIASEPTTVHDLLMQKSNGVFELAVWDEKVSGSDNVTVNFGATYSTVNVYDVTVGTSPTAILHDVASVPLTLSDHAMIIEVIAGP